MDRYIEFVTNHWMLFIALLVVTYLLIQEMLDSLLKNYEPISPILTVTMMNTSNDLIIMDVRETNEYSKSHIEDSVSTPLGDLEEHAKKLENKKSSPILVVCQSGTRSGPACKQLHKMGFTNLYTLIGGMQSWEENKLPVKKNKKN